MSGTSLDGVSTALVRLKDDPLDAQLVAFRQDPYTTPERGQIIEAIARGGSKDLALLGAGWGGVGVYRGGAGKAPLARGGGGGGGGLGFRPGGGGGGGGRGAPAAPPPPLGSMRAASGRGAASRPARCWMRCSQILT